MLVSGRLSHQVQRANLLIGGPSFLKMWQIPARWTTPDAGGTAVPTPRGAAEPDQDRCLRCAGLLREDYDDRDRDPGPKQEPIRVCPRLLDPIGHDRSPSL